MNKLIGLLLSAALITGLLAGCAGTNVENSSTSTPENTPAVSDTSTPEPSAEEAAWPRTITDDFGHTVTLEKKPERVVPLYFGHIESLVALGTPPVGSVNANAMIKNGGSAALKQIEDELNVVDLGNPLNLEKLLEVSPDLILGTANAVDSYEDYNKIAPTLLFNTSDWRDILNNYAQCLGAEAEAEQFIAELDSLIVEAREKLSAYQDKTFVITWDNGKNTFGAFGSKATSQVAFFDKEISIGLTPPEGYPEEYGQISLESLADFNPDYILIPPTLVDGQPSWLKEGTEDSAVWKSLKAVQSGNVFFLPSGAVTGSPMILKLTIETIVNSVVTE